MRLFLKPLSADAKYSRHIMGDLPQPIQMHLSWKPNYFSDNFIVFLEPASNLQHFGEKTERHSLSIYEIIHSEKRGYLNA